MCFLQRDFGDKRVFSERRRNDSYAEEEPEWFSGGPTSQSETIELIGFDDKILEDDKRRSKRSRKRTESLKEGRPKFCSFYNIIMKLFFLFSNKLLLHDTFLINKSVSASIYSRLFYMYIVQQWNVMVAKLRSKLGVCRRFPSLRFCRSSRPVTLTSMNSSISRRPCQDWPQ